MEETRQRHVLLLFAALLQSSNSYICTSIDARNNVTTLEALRGCTVVEGFVTVVLMKVEEVDFEPYSFPDLREVTQYMLFYRVDGLRSLGKLFPNLEKIGGQDLILDFALVIYEMFSLQEIGLTNLREISRGSVNIVKNPSLCFVETVKWNEITRWNAVRNYDVQNRDVASCPGCPDHCRDAACWNATHCQFEPEYAVREGCDPLCVGRCFEAGPQGCYSCRGFFDLQGNCVKTCPQNTYQYLNRRCITREECISKESYVPDSVPDGDDYSKKLEDTPYYYVIYEDQCLESCPSGYEPDGVRGTDCRPCEEGRCVNWCQGAVINSTGEAQMLRGCTHISGSIEITIKAETSREVHSVLEENLGSIEQITGYLQVTRSSVMDLSFFKNLSVIHGNDTHKQNYALVIISNENLQELWDWDVKHNFTILNGRLYFHFNPKLCLQHIYKLLDVIGYDKNVSSFEIGKESNGDKSPCNAIEINVTVTYRTFDRIEVHVPYMKINDTVPVLRYVVFYTKDPYKNITMFDDLDQCSDSGWKTKDISVVDPKHLHYKYHGFRVNLTELEPNTIYVFYVTTYTIYSVGARSSMHHECTLPSVPSELTSLQAYANSCSEISLKWEPPKHVNGKLKEYVVTWHALKEDRAFVDQRNYCEYPMVKDAEVQRENLRPEVKVDNKSCCSVEQYLPKEGFEMLCNNFVNVQFPAGFPDKTKYSSCESYFYSYIYNTPFHPSNNDDLTLHIPPLSNDINSFIRKKIGRNKLVSTFKNQISDDDLLLKYKIKPRVKRLPPHSKGVVLRDLKHFQNYVISVKACREVHPNEPDKSESNICSKSEIVAVRTRENTKSDAIPLHGILYDVKKGTLNLKWNPPENPNGLVVAFEIEYRHRHLENLKNMKECLTYTQYENNNNQHFIDGLLPGKYEFRIRAVSLFGEGPFTVFTAFDVVDSKSASLIEVLCVVLAVFVVIVLFSASSYFSKPSKAVVIADVNPNYHCVMDHYEIDRDDVEFGKQLGVGSFGKVYEGLLKSQNLRCAIKTVNEGASAENEYEFLIEASVMKSMTDAYFIVKLLGVVSRGRPPLVLMELMDHGDLKTYLRERREQNSISNATMIEMALEIADGMAYMEAQKFVHRDLAARNCMVSSELTIKVGDFGMARDIYETDYYRKKNKGFLPIRWMAPESLRDGEFTSQSDIWSYGVVLWEIVTMAEQPYQGFSNDEVLHDVIAGGRLEIPKISPFPLKTLMTICWRTKPTNRSSFMNIVGKLKYYHDEEFKRVSYFHSKEAEAARNGMWEYVEMQPVLDPLFGKHDKGSPPSTTCRLSTVIEENTN